MQQKEHKKAREAQPHLDILMKHVQPNTTSNKGICQGMLCLAENQESVDSLFGDAQIVEGFADADIVS